MNNIAEISKSFMNTFNTGDFAAMLGFFAEDSVYIDPHGVEHKGVSAIGDALAPNFEISDGDAHYEVTSTILDEDQSMALVTWTLLLTAADGTKSTIVGLDILHIRDGKIVLKNAFCKANEIAIRRVA